MNHCSAVIVSRVYRHCPEIGGAAARFKEILGFGFAVGVIQAMVGSGGVACEE